MVYDENINMIYVVTITTSKENTMALNVDLSKMSYDEFKTFMMGLATLYSDVDSNYNFISLYKDLKSIAKRIDRLPLDLFTIFGAYEIADNQVVLAVFKVNLEYKDDDSSPHISKTEVSFAEDTIYLRCPFSVRDLLSQPDYVAKAEEVYPRIMEELLKEKENERRKSKVKWTKEQIEEINKMIENDDIPF